MANVSSRWKDSAHRAKKRKMTLTGEEFIRRFLLHVLPKDFVRIRHFGWMANGCRGMRFERSEPDGVLFLRSIW
jgi:hypothetical protein